MGKQSGLGDRLFVAGYDLSGDIGSLSRVGGGPTQLFDVTDITQSAHERRAGLFDAAIEYAAYFNPDTGRAHERLSALPTTDQILTYGRGTALGSPAAGLQAKQLNYDGQRGQDGSLSLAIAAQAAAGTGLEWGRQLTAGIRTDTGATTGASLDLGSASPGAFGLVAYLQVFAFTGTDATIKIQESSDDGGADAFADVAGGAFGQITAGRSAQRITTAAINVERYLRVVTTTAGGFTSLAFAVMAIRYDTAQEF